jgi:hypothetical protein
MHCFSALLQHFQVLFYFCNFYAFIDEMCNMKPSWKGFVRPSVRFDVQTLKILAMFGINLLLKVYNKSCQPN